MAGLGSHHDKSRNSNSSALRKPMRFVKSSEILKVEESCTTSDQNAQATSQSAGRSNTQGPVSLMSLPLGSGGHRPPLHFGAPARNFSNFDTKQGASRGITPNPSINQPFVKAGSAATSRPSSGPGLGYSMPGQVHLNKGASKGPSHNFPPVAEAKPVCTVDDYLKAWRAEKEPELAKIRKLAYDVVTLKSNRPNAKDKLHSAANRVPLRIEFNTEPVFGARNSNSFLCYVYIEGISIASGQGAKIKDSKTNAYEAALQKILLPFMRIVQLDPKSRELQASRQQFTTAPPEPSKVALSRPAAYNAPQSKDTVKEVASQHKESNMEAACLKRRFNEYKSLDEFVIVEPLKPIPDCTPAHTLRRSADFNHMLLEYEYFFKGEAARCILKIENQVLADVNGISKAASKNLASIQALFKLKKFCWIIKTKQAVDSNTKISKEEMLNELTDQSDTISHDNIGNKLLRKMGWSGGGVGKDGSGISEPISLKSVLNREGLGLSAAKGVTDEFRKRIKEVIESYAASDNQEDLVFSFDFRLEERQIIHDECRRLNLRSKSRGKGQKRYLCVRRKRSVYQLFNHLMSCGGETARYRLVPPGQDSEGRLLDLANMSSVGHVTGSQRVPPDQVTPKDLAASVKQTLDNTQTTHRNSSDHTTNPNSNNLLGFPLGATVRPRDNFTPKSGHGGHSMSHGSNSQNRNSPYRRQTNTGSTGFNTNSNVAANSQKNVGINGPANSSGGGSYTFTGARNNFNGTSNNFNGPVNHMANGTNVGYPPHSTTNPLPNNIQGQQTNSQPGIRNTFQGNMNQSRALQPQNFSFQNNPMQQQQNVTNGQIGMINPLLQQGNISNNGQSIGTPNVQFVNPDGWQSNATMEQQQMGWGGL